jgi:hypothetical protein
VNDQGAPLAQSAAGAFYCGRLGAVASAARRPLRAAPPWPPLQVGDRVVLATSLRACAARGHRAATTPAGAGARGDGCACFDAWAGPLARQGAAGLVVAVGNVQGPDRIQVFMGARLPRRLTTLCVRSAFKANASFSCFCVFFVLAQVRVNKSWGATHWYRRAALTLEAPDASTSGADPAPAGRLSPCGPATGPACESCRRWRAAAKVASAAKAAAGGEAGELVRKLRLELAGAKAARAAVRKRTAAAALSCGDAWLPGHARAWVEWCGAPSAAAACSHGAFAAGRVRAAHWACCGNTNASDGPCPAAAAATAAALAAASSVREPPPRAAAGQAVPALPQPPHWRPVLAKQLSSVTAAAADALDQRVTAADAARGRRLLARWPTNGETRRRRSRAGAPCSRT